MTLISRGTNLAPVTLPMCRRPLLLAGLICLWVVPQSVHGQAVTGAGDDAIPIPRGGARISVGGLWNEYGRVFGDDGRTRPLLAPFSTTAAGPALFPQFGDAEQRIRMLTGQSNFRLSLGPLDAQGEVRQSIAPITIDYGVSSRLAIRLTVPYIESRDVNRLVLNADGTGANVGVNPALGSTGSSARAANGALVAQIEEARSLLRAEVARCAATAAVNCTVIRANTAGADALLDRAASTRSALIALYGDAQRAGAPLVPISGSTQQAAVVDLIRSLATDFRAFGIDKIGTSAAPAAATTVLGPGGISRVATDSTLGGRYRAIGNTRRAGIGDIDLTVTALLHDTFGANQVRRLLTPTRGVRSSLTAGWRFGTAGADRTEDPFDVPIGEGANALLVRSTTDFVLSRRAWLSATVRGVQPMTDRVNFSVLQADSLRLAPPAIMLMSRALGRRVEVEFAPRFAFGDFFGLSAAYLHRLWQSDRYTPVPADGTAAGPSATTASRTQRAAAIGVTFSTLASYARGRSRLPLEVLYTHTAAIGASGGGVPALSTDRLELRIYTGFPRR